MSRSQLTPEETALVERHRAFLDRRDEQWRLERKRRSQARYRQSDRGREAYRLELLRRLAPPHASRLPEAVAVRERDRQHYSTRAGPMHADPVLDTDGLAELLSVRSGPLPLRDHPQPPVQEARRRQLAAWERSAKEADEFLR